jgi:hypothetical protein
MSTDVLERELSSEVLYQPEWLLPVDDGKQRCNHGRCNKLAVWGFYYHVNDSWRCEESFFCEAHTDYHLKVLLDSFALGSVNCMWCATVFDKINDYVQVVRLP